MAISRMQQPRQMYGLGSLVKSVKKGVKSAVSGVKDFAKSDLGKAALLYAGTAGLGSLAAGKGFGSLLKLGTYAPSAVMGNLPGIFSGQGLRNIGGALGLGVPEGGKPTLGQFGKVFALGSLGGAALEALTASGADEEELENIRDVDTLRSYLRRGYEQLNPSAAPEQVEEFVIANTREYAAYGGRMGYQDGTPKEGIETLTPMKKPDGDVQYVRDMIKSLDGFAQLIAQEGNLDRQTFQNHMDMFEDFRQRKDIDAMPAYTYLKRRVEELNPEVAKMIYITQEDKPNESIYKKTGDPIIDRLMFLPKTLDKISEKIAPMLGYDLEKKANGGRMGFEGGTYTFEQFLKDKQQVDKAMSMEELRREYERMMKLKNIRDTRDIAAYGGRMGYALGDRAENNAMQASGIMNLPLNENPAGVTELDLRDSGGFIPPVGVKEKADDIPAMLSNNEFVFTADAVRGMGDGDVNKGAQRMYDMMKKLENGGRV
jgi:hypothetical protein